MPTVINNPQSRTDGSGLGLIIGIIVALLIIFAFIVYGLPALREQDQGTNINIPDEIDINVNQPLTN